MIIYIDNSTTSKHTIDAGVSLPGVLDPTMTTNRCRVMILGEDIYKISEKNKYYLIVTAPITMG
jgi:hypothetical protein